ncbi:MAG TPA: WD40 repeat domain-containing protein [Polyangiaceae bacterium]|nr:WD40 repeat domain-containing protein [Polyangiaceae bacterium]
MTKLAPVIFALALSSCASNQPSESSAPDPRCAALSARARELAAAGWLERARGALARARDICGAVSSEDADLDTKLAAELEPAKDGEKLLAQGMALLAKDAPAARRLFDRARVALEKKAGKRVSLSEASAAVAGGLVAMRPDKGAVAIAQGSTVLVVPLYDFTVVAEKLETKGGIATLAWARDSRWLAVGGTDGKATLWDLTNNKLLRTFEAGKGDVMVRFSHDGKRIAVAGKSLRIFDLDNGAVLGDLPFENDALADFVFVAHTNELLLRQGGRVVWVDIGSKKELKQNGVSDSPVLLAPDGQRVYAAIQQHVLTMIDRTRDAGRELATTGCFDKHFTQPQLTSDGKRLVTYRLDGTALVVSTKDGRVLAELAAGAPDPEGDGTTLARSGDRADVLESGKVARALEGLVPRGAELQRIGTEHALALGPGGLAIWNLKNGKRVFELGGGPGPVRSIHPRADGAIVAWQHATRRWDAGDRSITRPSIRIEPSDDGGDVYALPDASLLVRSGSELDHWDSKKGKKLGRKSAPSGGFQWARQGKWFALQFADLSRYDDGLQLWNGESGRSVNVALDAARARFSGDGTTLASWAAEKPIARAGVWSTAPAAKRCLLDPPKLDGSHSYNFALDRSGKRLAMAGGDLVILWDDCKQESMRTLTVPGVTRHHAFSPDGGTLWLHNYDGLLERLTIETKEIVTHSVGIPIHDSPSDLLVSPDGSHVAILDGRAARLHVWSGSGKPWKVDKVTAYAWSVDGHALYTGDDQGIIRLHRASDGAVQLEIRPFDADGNALARSADGSRVEPLGDRVGSSHTCMLAGGRFPYELCRGRFEDDGLLARALAD